MKADWGNRPSPVKILKGVTFLLIALNLTAAVHEYRLGPRNQLAFEQFFALSPEGIRSGHWWQFLTYQFLHARVEFRHGGFLHLLMNLLMLDSLGPVLETTLGRWRFAVLFLVSGIVGGVVHLLGCQLSPTIYSHPVVGASAGLCGLLAALGTIYSEDRIQVQVMFVFPLTIKAKYLLLAAGLISVVGVVAPFGRIAHFAHLGGLIGGLWCVNWLKVQTLLQIGEVEPLPPHVEPPSTS